MSFHGAFSFSVPIELKFLVSLVLPYIEVPNIPLGPVRVYPFGILVIAGILTGIRMILWRASKRGLDRQIAFRLCAITALFGLAGSYLLRLLFFSRGGIYSFGGLLSGLAGGACYLRWTKLRGAAALDYIDVLAFAFPFAWAFGRAGCSVAHDHPGVRTSSWLAVRFPDGPRYDLGLLELMFTLVLIALFLWLDRRPRPVGLYCGLFFALYGPFRFLLDGLHEPGVPRLLLTPDQWFGLLSTIAGVGVLWTARIRTAPPRMHPGARTVKRPPVK